MNEILCHIVHILRVNIMAATPPLSPRAFEEGGEGVGRGRGWGGGEGVFREGWWRWRWMEVTRI